MKRKLLAILVLLAMCISLAPAMAEEELPFVTIDWYFGQAEQTDSQIVNDALNEILLEKFNCNVNMHFWSGDEYWDNMRVMISSGQDVGIIGFGSQTKLDYVTESQRGCVLSAGRSAHHHRGGYLRLFVRKSGKPSASMATSMAFPPSRTMATSSRSSTMPPWRRSWASIWRAWNTIPSRIGRKCSTK